MRRCAITALAIAMFASMASADLVGTTDMQVQYSQLPDGNWEYIYDFYGSGVKQLARIGLIGLDGQAVVNQYDGYLMQKWDYLAATNTPSYATVNYGSYSPDGESWLLTGGPWAIDNSWHDPDDYAGVPTYFAWPLPSFLDPGEISLPVGESIWFTAKITGGTELHEQLLSWL